MMSPENIPQETHSSAGNNNRKSSSAQRAPPDQQALKCPRCDSANTKFCYYNNYSLSQPRHFCKTCRRYWTKGGALRNVPIGGGCRKTKKHKSSSSSSTAPVPRLGEAGDFGFGPGFKFMSPGPPGAEFQLGGLSLPRLHPATPGVYTQFITSTVANGSGPMGCFGLDLLGPMTSPVTSTVVQGVGGGGGGGGDQQISISSIESLSSINQEMHWKLQQQRLALIYGAGDHDDQVSNNKLNKEKTQTHGGINLFQNLGINNINSNDDNSSGQKCTTVEKLEVGSSPTEWFFDQGTNNYGQSNNTSVSTTSNSCNNNGHEVENMGSHLNRVQAAAVWTDLHHFHGLQ